jgi:hypothetical protein
MNFENASKELFEGKKIRRKEWEHFMHLKIVDDLVQTFKGENITFFGDAKILTTHGWRVVGWDGEPMSFVQSLEQLKQKKSVTHDILDGGFLFVDQGNLAICRPVKYDFMPSYKDFCSNDWEVVK